MATGGMATGGMATGGMATGGMAAGGMAAGGMAVGVGGVTVGGVVEANEEGESSPVISRCRDNGSLERRGVELDCTSDDNSIPVAGDLDGDLRSEYLQKITKLNVFQKHLLNMRDREYNMCSLG